MSEAFVPNRADDIVDGMIAQKTLAAAWSFYCARRTELKLKQYEENVILGRYRSRIGTLPLDKVVS